MLSLPSLSSLFGKGDLLVISRDTSLLLASSVLGFLVLLAVSVLNEEIFSLMPSSSASGQSKIDVADLPRSELSDSFRCGIGIGIGKETAGTC